MTLIKRGSNIGNERTGYKVPFELALEIIAAIKVEADARPKLPRKIVKRKIESVLTVKEGIVTVYAIMIRVLRIYSRSALKASLPRSTDDGFTQSCNVIEVPRSSSLTKERDSPLMAAKKMIIHRIPAERLGETVSPAVENSIIERVTTTNIISALRA